MYDSRQEYVTDLQLRGKFNGELWKMNHGSEELIPEGMGYEKMDEATEFRLQMEMAKQYMLGDSPYEDYG